MSAEIILYTQNAERATNEITKLGGRVTHQFSEFVLVAHLPESAGADALKESSPKQPEALDAVSLMAVQAWKNLHVKRMAGAPKSAKEGLSWDTPGYSSPAKATGAVATKMRQAVGEEHLPEESTGTPTSRYMLGSVSVGIVIVSSTRPDLALSSAEQQQIIQEVQEGLNFLATVEPRAKVTFVYDIRVLTVSVAPGSTADWESAEAPWRNAALAQMGFQPNRQGSIQYVRNLVDTRKTNWGYVGYFTKYPLHHFAYAIDEKLCMNYYNDNWGPAEISRVFAHETCHIFGAADEYGACDCNPSGHLGVPNNNCVRCPGPHVQCLMDANVLEMCQWSRGQIGWDDRLLPSQYLAEDYGHPTGAPGWSVVGVGDFNGNGSSDLVWRRSDQTGEARIWMLNHTEVQSDLGLPPGAPGWKVVGVGDFNGDGKDDLVWRRQDDSGEARIWLLNDGQLVSDIGLPNGAPGWKIVGVGDFNGDGQDDLLWRRQDDSGEVRVWLLNQGQLVADIGLPAGDPGWKIVGVGDFNGDGKDDLLWRRQDESGELRIWLLDGGNLVADIPIFVPEPDWKIVGIGDFNGDGKADLLWRRRNDTSETRVWILKGI